MKGLPWPVRRGVVRVGLALAMVAVSWGLHAQPRLPVAHDLAQQALQAQRKNQPLVVMVTLQGCVWCRLVREHYLYPAWEKGQMAVVEVDVQGPGPLRSFSGQTTTHMQWARQNKAAVTPTLYFFNAQGSHLAPPLEGVSSVDFYGAYLAQRLEQAQGALDKTLGSPAP